MIGHFYVPYETPFMTIAHERKGSTLPSCAHVNKEVTGLFCMCLVSIGCVIYIVHLNKCSYHVNFMN